MSSTPLLPLTAGIVYAGGYPFASGPFFTMLFGTESQNEYDALKQRYGKEQTVLFFRQFESLVDWALEFDPQSQLFRGTWSSPGITPNPDPAVSPREFALALRSAGTTSGTFSSSQLLDRLLSPAVHERAEQHLHRTYGASSTEAFDAIFKTVVLDAAQIR